MLQPLQQAVAARRVGEQRPRGAPLGGGGQQRAQQPRAAPERGRGRGGRLRRRQRHRLTWSHQQPLQQAVAARRVGEQRPRGAPLGGGGQQRAQQPRAAPERGRGRGGRLRRRQRHRLTWSHQQPLQQAVAARRVGEQRPRGAPLGGGGQQRAQQPRAAPERGRGRGGRLRRRQRHRLTWSHQQPLQQAVAARRVGEQRPRGAPLGGGGQQRAQQPRAAPERGRGRGGRLRRRQRHRLTWSHQQPLQQAVAARRVGEQRPRGAPLGGGGQQRAQQPRAAPERGRGRGGRLRRRQRHRLTWSHQQPLQQAVAARRVGEQRPRGAPLGGGGQQRAQQPRAAPERGRGRGGRLRRRQRHRLTWSHQQPLQQAVAARRVGEQRPRGAPLGGGGQQRAQQPRAAPERGRGRGGRLRRRQRHRLTWSHQQPLQQAVAARRVGEQRPRGAPLGGGGQQRAQQPRAAPERGRGRGGRLRRRQRHRLTWSHQQPLQQAVAARRVGEQRPRGAPLGGGGQQRAQQPRAAPERGRGRGGRLRRRQRHRLTWSHQQPLQQAVAARRVGEQRPRGAPLGGGGQQRAQQPRAAPERGRGRGGRLRRRQRHRLTWSHQQPLQQAVAARRVGEQRPRGAPLGGGGQQRAQQPRAAPERGRGRGGRLRRRQRHRLTWSHQQPLQQAVAARRVGEQRPRGAPLGGGGQQRAQQPRAAPERGRGRGGRLRRRQRHRLTWSHQQPLQQAVAARRVGEQRPRGAPLGGGGQQRAQQPRAAPERGRGSRCSRLWRRAGSASSARAAPHSAAAGSSARSSRAPHPSAAGGEGGDSDVASDTG
ncbi:uncharacterized protein LOC134744975 [Cydia strobilella]|uniref:uncharacterized protein LOC134744975 n=1 Tax=Cydia strobilella TaxID=1100964 RepID=UPI003005FB5A